MPITHALNTNTQWSDLLSKKTAAYCPKDLAKVTVWGHSNIKIQVLESTFMYPKVATTYNITTQNETQATELLEALDWDLSALITLVQNIPYKKSVGQLNFAHAGLTFTKERQNARPTPRFFQKRKNDVVALA